MDEQISDHQACFLLLKYLRREEEHANKHITITYRNSNFIENVRRDLASVDFMSHLLEDDDPNVNNRCFEEIVTGMINKYTETKRVRFKKYRHTRTPWITTGILSVLDLSKVSLVPRNRFIIIQISNSTRKMVSKLGNF